MIDLINEVRAENGLGAFRSSSTLAGSARRFSRWLMEHDAFRHSNTIQASSDFTLLGEALELHTGHRFNVRATVNRWLGSPSHRAIVLSKTMRWVGAGVRQGRFGARPSTIWVLHVGRLKPPGARTCRRRSFRLPEGSGRGHDRLPRRHALLRVRGP